MNKELKPCPFCGGKANLLKVSKYESFVQCNRKCVEQTRLYTTDGAAIKAWNRRKWEYTEQDVRDSYNDGYSCGMEQAVESYKKMRNAYV